MKPTFFATPAELRAWFEANHQSAKELLDTKGSIHIWQIRASFPVSEGVSFPLAFSYSNRSELIKGRSFWQGHFGVSYDFSQLAKKVQKSTIR